MQIDILIVVKDQLPYLKACIESIQKHTSNYNLLIYNNGSEPETTNYLAKIPNATVIYATENDGFIRPNNRLAELSKADYLVLLNSDTTVKKGWDKKLIDYLQNDQQTKLVGYLGCFLDPQLGNHGGSGGYGSGVDYICGWCMCLSKQTYQQFGLFDETNLEFAYFEDTDLSLRIREAGYKIHALPDQLVEHVGNVTIKAVGPRPKAFLKNESYMHQRWDAWLEDHLVPRTIALATHFYQIKKQNEAAELLHQVIQVEPNNAPALVLLGLIESDFQMHVEAEQHLTQATIAEPTNAQHWDNLGVVQQNAQKYAEANDSFNKSLDLNPHDFASWFHLSQLFQRNKQFEIAEKYLNKAIELKPELHWLRFNKGVLLGEAERFAESNQCYEQALELKPNDPASRYNLGCNLLLMGEWQKAWKHYEYRWQAIEPEFDFRKFLGRKAPEWNGEDLHGKTLLLHCTQGNGDRIQFIRLTALLKNKFGARRIYFLSVPQLTNIMKRIDAIDDVFEYDGAMKHYDYHCDLLSLPLRMNLTQADLLDPMGYQCPWICPPYHDRKGGIGICWGGNPKNRMDHIRSCPLKYFEVLKDYNLISFQKEKAPRVLPGIGIVDLMEGATIDPPDANMEDYLATARSIKETDLMVTIDTSVAHLSGAMGHPTALILAKIPDWRYGLTGDTNCWYPSTKIFRQTEAGKWDNVLREVKAWIETKEYKKLEIQSR